MGPDSEHNNIDNTPNDPHTERCTAEYTSHGIAGRERWVAHADRWNAAHRTVVTTYQRPRPSDHAKAGITTVAELSVMSCHAMSGGATYPYRTASPGR